MNTFGQRLRELRGEMTQAEAAAKIGVNAPAYVMYETDRREANFAVLNQVADCYGVTIDYLMGRTDVKSPSTEMQAICKTTNLTEKALQTIVSKEFQRFDERMFHRIDALNLLLECDIFKSCITAICMCLSETLNGWKDSTQGTENREGRHTVYLTGKFAAEFYKTQSLEMLNETLTLLMMEAEEKHGRKKVNKRSRKSKATP